MRLYEYVVGSWAMCVLPSCGQSPPPPAPHPVIVSMAPSASVSASASALAQPSADAPSSIAEPVPSAKPPTKPSNEVSRHKVDLVLEPGGAPCTISMDGVLFEDHPEWFTITNVVRMATEDGGGCAANVFYDFAKETKPDPSYMDPTPLLAGPFHKPGQTAPADMPDDHSWNMIEDLNFDNIADLCIVNMTGAYNYSQYCWLFDPSTHKFVRNTDLDELIFMDVDLKHKKLKNSFRAGGPVYENNEYEWRNGKLVNTYKSVSYFGEKPDGTPLAAGYISWLITYEMRNGKLVKVHEGAMREK